MTDLTLSIIRPFYLVYVFWLFLKLRTKTEKNAFSRFKTVEYLFLFLACDGFHGRQTFFLVFKFKKSHHLLSLCAKSVFSYFIFPAAQVFMITIYIVYDNKRSFYSLKKTFISQLVSFSQPLYGFGYNNDASVKLSLSLQLNAQVWQSSQRLDQLGCCLALPELSSFG